jgi:hypothetical protein
VAAHDEERGEVGKKERKKKRACAQTSIRSRVSASLVPYSVSRAPAMVAPFGSYVVRPPSSWTDYGVIVLGTLLFTWGARMDDDMYLGTYMENVCL